MSDREKELTILVAEGCQITTEMLPHWEYCRNLGFRMNRHLGGGVSIKFKAFSDVVCEFRWRGKFVATIYFLNSTDMELRVATRNRPGQLPERYPIERIWETAFRPAFAALLFLEREDLKAVEQKIGAALP